MMLSKLKSEILRGLYVFGLRPVLFLFDAERVHRAFVRLGRSINSSYLIKRGIRGMFNYEDKLLEQKIGGMKFRNPIGLAAGFDKNGELPGLMGDLGFGFTEVGSVSARACEGNKGKRLRRHIKEEGIWVNLGLNNEGADKIYLRLREGKREIPMGINIAKTNCKETADSKEAVKDYVYSLKRLRGCGEYFVLNISCPNAFGGQPFSNPKLYEQLLNEVDKLNLEKPVFVKLSPDLSRENVEEILKISDKHKIGGFICSNLTKKGAEGSGGFSGKIVTKGSDELLSFVYARTRGKYILVGCGGVFSAEDAYRKIKLGANLIQLVTGMIYEGPGVAGKINRELAEKLRGEGYRSIKDAVGSGN